MMKDVSLRGKNDVSNELIVNKIQDFAWDEVLMEFVTHPKVLVSFRQIRMLIP
jgi:hypothetical protein